MKRLSKLTKGILLTLILGMALNLVPIFNSDGTDNVYAQSDEDIIDPAGTGLTSTAEDAAASEGGTSTASEVSGEGSSVDQVLAELAKPGGKPTINSEEIISEVAVKASRLHRLFAPMINFFSYQIGNFLGNDYIYEGAMGDMLHKIWVISRNLVNIVFVFLLLWMALKTIFSVKETDMSDLKNSLIKFTLLLIFVNFTWLTTKVILDAAHVATQVVFAIPSGVAAGTEFTQCQVDTMGKEPIKGACVPTTILAPADSGPGKIYYFEDDEGENDDCAEIKEAYRQAYDPETGEKQEPMDEKYKDVQGNTAMCMENLNLNKYDQNTAVIYLTYGLARIQNLTQSVAGNDPVQLSVGVLFSIIMQTAYALALAALFVTLIVRMMVLWILVAFSPFIVLVMYFNDNMFENSGDVKFGWKEFVDWAFAPAKVGMVFAVSFIMISAGQSVGNVISDNVTNESGVTFKILEGQSLFMGMDNLQMLIWLIMSIAVLWLGVFSILSKMSYIEGIAGNIKTATLEKARTIAKAPLVAPILPLGKGQEPTSIASTLGSFDFTKKIDEWEGKAKGSGEGDVLTLDRKARQVNVDRYVKPLLADINNKDNLNALAKQLGSGSARDLARDYNQDQIKAALESHPGIREPDAEKIASKFASLKPEAPKTKSPSQAPAAENGGSAAGGNLTQSQVQQANENALAKEHQKEQADKKAPSTGVNPSPPPSSLSGD